MRISNYSISIMKLASGSIGAQICWMMAMAFLARLYEPANFGTYQVFISTGNIFLMISMLRYEMAIILPKYDYQAFGILTLSIISCFVFSILSAGVVLILERMLLRDELLFSVVCYLPVYLFLVSGYQAFYNWFVRVRAFDLIPIILMIYPIFFVVMAIGCYYYGFNELALIKSVLGARLVQLLVLVFFFMRAYKKYFRAISINKILKMAKKHSAFPKYMVCSGLVDTLTAEAPVYCLQTCFSSDILGYYSVTIQALAAPGAFVAKTIGDVFRQRASWLFQHNGECKNFYKENLTILVKIALLLFLSILFFAPFAYGFVFGSKWAFSGDLARWMSLGVVCSLVASPLSMMFVIAEKQKFYLQIHIVRLFMRVAVLAFCGFVLNDIIQTVFFDAILTAGVSSYIVYKGLHLTNRQIALKV